LRDYALHKPRLIFYPQIPQIPQMKNGKIRVNL